MSPTSQNGSHSNAAGFWIGGLLCGATWVALGWLDPHFSHPGSGPIALAAFAAIPLGIAIAELRSGYAWKNLAPGGRGLSCAESQAKYWRSVAFHLLLSGVITCFAAWTFLHP